jgi:hypothetical protein
MARAQHIQRTDNKSNKKFRTHCSTDTPNDKQSLNSHNIATSYRIRSRPILVVTAKRRVQWNITGIRSVHLSKPRMTKNQKSSLRFRLSSHWLLINPTKSPLPMSKTSFGFAFKSSAKVQKKRDTFNAIIDTGSTLSLMPASIANELGLRIQPNSSVRINFAERHANSLGMVLFNMTIGSESHSVTAHVLKHFAFTLLLGLNIAKQFPLIIDWQLRTATLRERKYFRESKSCLNISVNTGSKSRKETKQPIHPSVQQVIKENKYVFAEHDRLGSS